MRAQIVYSGYNLIFFGYIEYKNWSGKIVAVLRIENGKVARGYKLSNVNEEQLQISKQQNTKPTANGKLSAVGPATSSTLEEICDWVLMPIFELVCEVIDDGNPNDENLNEIVCTLEEVGERPEWVCTWVEVPDPEPCPWGNCDEEGSCETGDCNDPPVIELDCAGVQNGTAVTECGYCIGGTTGLSSPSQLGDSPNTGATASINQVPPSAASVSKLGSDWGMTEIETVDLTIGASLNNCVWTAVLISAKGNYSLQARLVPGCSEVSGNTTSSNYCHQVFDLKNLGGSNTWYMLSAIIAHENVHVSRLGPGLNDALTTIEADVKTLTVPATGQTKAQAISQLRALAGFQIVEVKAKKHWGDVYYSLVLGDHTPNGPTDTAERSIVDPVGTSICNLKTSNPSWPACSYCPY